MNNIYDGRGFLDILKSRRFWTTVFSSIFGSVVILASALLHDAGLEVPEDAVIAFLIAIFSAAGINIIGYSAQDVANARNKKEVGN